MGKQNTLDLKKDSFLCADPNCKNKNFGGGKKKFFKFPDDPKRIRLWLQSLRRTDLLNKLNQAKKLRVCEDHFTPNMLLEDKSDVASFAVPFIKRLPVPIRVKKESKDTNSSDADRSASSPTFVENENGPVIYSPVTAAPHNTADQNNTHAVIPNNSLLCEVCRRLVPVKEASKYSYVLTSGWKMNLCFACEKNLRGLKGMPGLNREAINPLDTCEFCKDIAPNSVKYNPSAWHPTFRRLFNSETMSKNSINICQECEQHINQLCSRMWNACRVCGKNSISLIDIIETSSVQKKMGVFVNICISPLNGLPNYICTECDSELDKVYKLYRQIIRMNEKFKTIRNQSLISYELNTTIGSNMQNGTTEVNVTSKNPASSDFLMEEVMDDSHSETISVVDGLSSVMNTSTEYMKKSPKRKKVGYKGKMLRKTYNTRQQLTSKKSEVVRRIQQLSGVDTSTEDIEQLPETEELGHKRSLARKTFTRSQTKLSKPEVEWEVQPLLDSSCDKTCYGIMRTVSVLSPSDESENLTPILEVIRDAILSGESKAGTEEIQYELNEEDYVVNEI